MNLQTPDTDVLAAADMKDGKNLSLLGAPWLRFALHISILSLTTYVERREHNLR